VQAAEKILSGPDYFYCERFRVKMPKACCLKRRHRAIEAEIGCNHDEDDPDLAIRVECCLECDQGDEVYEDILKRMRARRNARRARMNRPRVVTRKGHPGIKGQVYKELGKKALEIRQHLNVSQEEMARCLHVNQTIVSNLENRKPVSKKTAGLVEEGLEKLTAHSS